MHLVLYTTIQPIWLQNQLTRTYMLTTCIRNVEKTASKLCPVADKMV